MVGGRAGRGGFIGGGLGKKNALRSEAFFLFAGG